MMKKSMAAAIVVFFVIAGLSAQDLPDQAKALATDLFARQLEKVTPRFNDRMAAGLPPDKLAALIDDLLAKTGPLRAIQGTHAEEVPGYRVIFVTCQFEKASLDLRLVFDPEGRVAGMFFVPSQPREVWSAPDYAAPGSFQERDVTVVSGRYQLPGTLTLPPGAGPFPAVALVHGSGPHDRDETIGPNKPFKDLACGLAARGVAVLRYTKRTYRMAELKEPLPQLFTVNEETVEDARAAATLLAATESIDRKRIYVLGHSLGGMLAPRIAEGDAQIAGLILLAGSTRPLVESILEQLKYLAGLPGTDAAAVQKQIQAATEAAARIQDPALEPTAMIDLIGSRIPGSYFLDLRKYHPAETAARLKIPMLILQGERDYQVTVKDFEGWQAGLKGRSGVTFRTYPGLTHLFMTSLAPGDSPGTPQDYARLGHVAPSVIADIATWIQKQ